MNKFVGFLRLMRLANIVTAISDILAGIAISHYFNHPNTSWTNVGLLVLSTIGLYGGGVVLNDVYDADLDKAERPERPIPSGLIPKSQAAWLGVILLLIGVLAASAVALNPSGYIALLIVVSVNVYDKWAKHHVFFGPLTMGACRGLNLLLGISIIPIAISVYSFLTFIPVLYIAAITMISRGEVHGGKSKTLYAAGVFYCIVVAAIAHRAYLQDALLYTVLFLVIFSGMVFPPLSRAIQKPEGKRIGLAVKAGVIALIAMNAAWAAAFGMIYMAIAIMILLPLSLFLSKLFAVT